MPKLVEGLKILEQADPCAQYLVQETGEHVILAAGEIHLQRCIKDLRERFAKCEIQASEAIVPFRETAVKAPDMAPVTTPGASRGTIQTTVYDGLVNLTLRAVPLPAEVIEFLLANQGTIGSMLVQRRRTDDGDDEIEDDDPDADASGTRTLSAEQFWTELSALLDKAGGEWVGAADRIWTFGPKKVGANLLLDPVGHKALRLRGREEVFAKLRAEGQTAEEALAAAEAAEAEAKEAEVHNKAALAEGDERAAARLMRDFDHSIETGFQLATFQGPLCAEPVVGMAWVVESVEYNPQEEQGMFTGHKYLLTSRPRSGFRHCWCPYLERA
jgi:ribosome assembly protein 1